MSATGGGGAGLMSCVREGSLEPPYRPPHADTTNHVEGRTGRFLRGLRRMFKRRGSGSRADASPDPKSSSTSELLDADRHARRKEGVYGSGLSVSHDSVFTGERSGDESSDERPPHSHSHTHGHAVTSHRAELAAAVRRRGRDDDDDEDDGLPRSPPASPPTDKADKRHHAGISQSSCSDGSLLSVGSSEMDEDSSSGHHHDHSARSDHSDFYNSSEPPSGVAPLSHSAAKHKMAVRPRRTHGAPRRKKNNPITASALPITPELNEEMIRSTTPEAAQKSSEVVTESSSSSTTTKHHMIVTEQHQILNRELQRVLETPSDTKQKSSSLPPGLALSQLVGQSPTKLTIAESNTPRSSIKRSKSSTQGQPLREGSPISQITSETKMQSYYSEERVSKHRTDKHAEESCQEKKSKSEKKIDSDSRSKKDESFFSRWLMRKSGKKAKKDQTDGESQQDTKKPKMEKSTAQYKPIDSEKSAKLCSESGQAQKSTSTQKSAGQKAFANSMHKRIDNKGAYVQDNIVGIDYINDLKIAEETDKMLNLDIKNRYSKRDDCSEKPERINRTSYKDAVDDNKRDSINILHDKTKKSTFAQRPVDPFSSKAFINNEIATISKEESLSPSLVISDEEPPIRAIRIKKVHNDSVFHSGSMPKNIPYFNPNILVSDNASPPKITSHQNSECMKLMSRSAELPELRETRTVETTTRRDKSYRFTKTEESYVGVGLRSLGDEYVETRSSIGKSHSFRYASESTSVSSQESQMPSLPVIVGISEPLLESWEVNYRKNLSERHDYSKRVSARNYNILHGNAEANYDSLPSTDSSYLDSLKSDANDDRRPFTNSIHITLDTNKRDSDISQIEAKIDDIISSPKPIMAPILKSSSLDSVKSSPEKVVEDRRKTISIESSLSQSQVPSDIIMKKEIKPETENFVSVTHINKEQSPVSVKTIDLSKTKSEERVQKTDTNKPGLPEFLFLQLNKVDPKPATHVVLTANVTPKKIDCLHNEKKVETTNNDFSEPKSVHNIQVRRDSVISNKTVENTVEHNVNQNSPLLARKSVTPPVAPQTPTTPKTYFKKKSISIETQDKSEKVRTNSLSTEGSTEKIHDNISIDQKSHSSFGSKSSIHSTDSNEAKAPDRNEEAVIYRRKPLFSKETRSDKKNDDEPELMKVFARRSLKLKDSDVENLAQEISETNNKKDETDDNITATRTKILKNEFNASIKSRDSDKENEDIAPKASSEERPTAISTRLSHFGIPHYQRSVSITSVSNPKRESAPTFRSEVNKYKKEVSDSTPEKRLRNRTFPDLSNDRDDIKNIARTDAFKDTLTKRSWQKRDDERLRMPADREKRESAVIEKDGDKEKCEGEKENGAEEEVDESLQFKCIFERRAEWEKRAQQGMTK